MTKSHFQNILFLTPKSQNLDFSKTNSYKIEILEDIKNEIYSMKLYSNKQCTRFQANIFILGCAMAQKSGKGDDVTF